MTSSDSGWAFASAWALGYGNVGDGGKLSGKIIINPDAVWALVSALWLGLLLRNIRKFGKAAACGDEYAARSLVLPMFRPVLSFLAKGMLVYTVVCVVMCLFAANVLRMSSGAAREALVAIAAFTRFTMFEVIVQSFGLLFLLEPSLTEAAWRRARLYALAWGVVYGSLNAGLFVTYDLHDSSADAPLWAAVGCEAFVALFYLVAVFVLKIGRRAVRPYALFTIVWRACGLVMLLCVLLPDMDGPESGGGPSTGGGTGTRTLIFNITFLVIQVLGFPGAVHSTVDADTKYWRGIGRSLPDQEGRRWYQALWWGVWGISGLGMGLRGYGGTRGDQDPGLRRWAERQPLIPDAQSEGLQKVIESSRRRTLDFAFLRLGELLDRGAMAAVYSARYKDMPVAVKVFTPPELTDQELEEVAKEAGVCGALQHPNVVRFYGLCVCPPDLSLVFELCERGSLLTVLADMSVAMRRAGLFVGPGGEPLPVEDDPAAASGSGSGSGSGEDEDDATGEVKRTPAESAPLQTPVRRRAGSGGTGGEEADGDADGSVPATPLGPASASASAATAGLASTPASASGFADLEAAYAAGISASPSPSIYYDSMTGSARSRSVGRIGGAGAGHAGRAEGGGGDGLSVAGSPMDSASIGRSISAVGMRRLVSRSTGDLLASEAEVYHGGVHGGGGYGPAAHHGAVGLDASVHEMMRDMAANAAAQPYWQRRLTMAIDAARAVAYLHAQSPCVIHRDIKSPNFLVTKRWRLKLADFGESRALRAAGELTGWKGTVQWMCPEMLAGEEYGASADVYSLGVVLWELLTCQVPLRGVNAFSVPIRVIRDRWRPIVPAWTPPALARLLRRMWSSSPAARPAMPEVVSELEALYTATITPPPGARPAASSSALRGRVSTSSIMDGRTSPATAPPGDVRPVLPVGGATPPPLPTPAPIQSGLSFAFPRATPQRRHTEDRDGDEDSSEAADGLWSRKAAKRPGRALRGRTGVGAHLGVRTISGSSPTIPIPVGARRADSGRYSHQHRPRGGSDPDARGFSAVSGSPASAGTGSALDGANTRSMARR